MAAEMMLCRSCFRASFLRWNQVSKISVKNISTNSACFGGAKFRRSQGKADDSLAYGPLTDTPDWTYLDGSIPPPSSRQLQRFKARIETANRVVTMLKEINAAKELAAKKKDIIENSIPLKVAE